MWFIKDPQAQDSHPIRDILDRPTLTQLRKICVSGVMYSFVVACVVGSVAGLLYLGSKSILPFRWKNRSVSIDLCFGCFGLMELIGSLFPTSRSTLYFCMWSFHTRHITSDLEQASREYRRHCGSSSPAASVSRRTFSAAVSQKRNTRRNIGCRYCTWTTIAKTRQTSRMAHSDVYLRRITYLYPGTCTPPRP